MYTDHQGTDDQCSPPSSAINATCYCLSMPPGSAHQCHINATYQCPYELPFSASYQCHQCRLSVPVSASYQCHLSVPYMSASFQCP
ncbi:unnamed protein product [Staurois parvus]|uniref:Uncharacterized protein n=1 Tax=Staurois parvus TaxID=386267 RepID=A0ABN9BLG2_9NEOB|nr:unnamed protein product [Staurois parvus]